MARQSYGRRMSEWEREKDELDWRRALETALKLSDMSLVEELIKEGVSDSYSFAPFYDNDDVIRILDELLK